MVSTCSVFAALTSCMHPKSGKRNLVGCSRLPAARRASGLEQPASVRKPGRRGRTRRGFVQNGPPLASTSLDSPQIPESSSVSAMPPPCTNMAVWGVRGTFRTPAVICTIRTLAPRCARGSGSSGGGLGGWGKVRNSFEEDRKGKNRGGCGRGSFRGRTHWVDCRCGVGQSGKGGGE